MGLEAVRARVFAEKPVLKEIMDAHGSRPLSAHFSAYAHATPAQLPAERLIKLVDVVRKILRERLPADVADGAAEQLSRSYYVSTADHHGFLCHPFFSNEVLVQSITNREAGMPYTIVFPCAGISLDNSSYPRGHLVHDQLLREMRLPFFSLKQRHVPVYVLDAYKGIAVERACSHVDELGVSRIRKRMLKDTLLDTCTNKEVLAMRRYAEQATRANYELWKRVPGEQESQLIYVEQEEIVRRLLIEHHIPLDTLISRILCHEDARKSFLELFDGISGAFSRSSQKGSELFWGIHTGTRVCLRVRDGYLEGEGMRIPLTPESVCQGLKDYRLMPTMALTFITLSFYHGLACGGGFSQVNYLTHMQSAYLELLARLGADEVEAAIASSVDTKFFSGDIMLVVLEANGVRIPATPLDMVLYGTEETYKSIVEASQRMSLGEGTDAMMHELYKILTGTTIPAFPAPHVAAIHVH